MSHVEWSVTYSTRIIGMRLKHCKQRKKRPTRLLLLAQHASEDGYRAIVIVADDTDVVMVLCISFRKTSVSTVWYTNPNTVHRHWRGCRLLWR